MIIFHSSVLTCCVPCFIVSLLKSYVLKVPCQCGNHCFFPSKNDLTHCIYSSLIWPYSLQFCTKIPLKSVLNSVCNPPFVQVMKCFIAGNPFSLDFCHCEYYLDFLFLYINIFVVHIFQNNYVSVIHIYFLILFRVNLEMCNDATYLSFHWSVFPFRLF
jgi:hypothetical protein